MNNLKLKIICFLNRGQVISGSWLHTLIPNVYTSHWQWFLSALKLVALTIISQNHKRGMIGGRGNCHKINEYINKFGYNTFITVKIFSIKKESYAMNILTLHFHKTDNLNRKFIYLPVFYRLLVIYQHLSKIYLSSMYHISILYHP